MIRSIRGFPLLEGVRGDAPSDLDINPFLAAPRDQKSCAVDVRIRIERD